MSAAPLSGVSAAPALSASSPGAAAAGHPPSAVAVTVILPAFNEEQALPQVIGDLRGVLGPGSEILVVDDGSTDGTTAAAEAGGCRLIRHPENRGKGAAVRTGLANAHGQYVVVMDADATYPAAAVPQIVERLHGHDVVRCRRERRRQHMRRVNRIGNWLFDRLLALAHGLEGADHLSGMYGLRREAAAGMFLEAEGFDIEAEIGIKARVRGLRVATFPIAYQPRLGEKKLRPWHDGVLILGRILMLFLVYSPLRVFVGPGLVLMVLALSGAAILSRGPVITPYFGLSIHSYIVATLGALAAFQLIIFGMASALYGVEVGYRPPRWLVFLSSRPLRLAAGGLGLLLAVAAAAAVGRLIVRWLANGAGIFQETRALVLAATALVWGLQAVSAGLFLSIFAGRLQRFKRDHLGGHAHVGSGRG
jgi:glycosyltransferase involved in cell wall biosynthesis